MPLSTESAPDELQLFIIGPHWGLPSMSPFGIKLATWLRVAGIPHELRFGNDPRKGPKRKSPWIVDDGRAIGDSELVVAHLAETRGVDPDAALSARDRAVALLLRRTFEEHFHQVLEYALWVLDEGWEQSQAHFDEILPALVRPILKKIIRRECRKEGFIRGVARHDRHDMAKMAADDIGAASALLGDKPYLFGDRPTTADCTVFGFLAHTLWAPIPYFAQEELKRYANLVEFCERMRARYWPEPATEGPWRPDEEPAVQRASNAEHIRPSETSDLRLVCEGGPGQPDFFEERSRRGSKVPLHRHPWPSWELVLEGTLRMRVEDQEIRLGPGDSLYVPPNVAHGYVVESESAWTVGINMSDGRFPDFLRKAAQRRPSAADGDAPGSDDITDLAEACGLELLGPSFP